MFCLPGEQQVLVSKRMLVESPEELVERHGKDGASPSSELHCINCDYMILCLRVDLLLFLHQAASEARMIDLMSSATYYKRYP